MLLKETSRVLVSEMPLLVVFWIVPPDALPPCTRLPSPVTVRPPLVPVLFSTMPLTAPFAEMLWKVKSLAPIVVLATLWLLLEFIVLLTPHRKTCIATDCSGSGFCRRSRSCKTHTEVLHVAGTTDYRLRVLERADVYVPTWEPRESVSADERLSEFFAAIAPDEGDQGGTIDVLGRPIAYRRAADGVIWFDFAQICDGPRSQDDYIEAVAALPDRARLERAALRREARESGTPLHRSSGRILRSAREADRVCGRPGGRAVPRPQAAPGVLAHAQPFDGDAEPRLPRGRAPSLRMGSGSGSGTVPDPEPDPISLSRFSCGPR